MVDLDAHLSSLSFDDPAGFLVLADWLQAKQDPWGELIALQVASKPEHQPRIMELLGELNLAGTARCEWHLGFARSVTLFPEEPTVPSMVAAMTEFFARPVARLCDGVTFAPKPAQLATIRDWGASERIAIHPYKDCGEALLQHLPDRVRRVGFGETPPPPITGYVHLPDFRMLSGWLQRITELTLIGNDSGATASMFLLPNLVKLTLRAADLSSATISSLVNSNVPKLEEMWLSFGGSANCILDDVMGPDDYDEEDPDALRYPATFSPDDLAALEVHGVDSDPNFELGRLGEATSFPALTRLSLNGTVLSEGSIEQLAQAKLLRQLGSLDLSNTSLDERAVARLVRDRDKFEHIKNLDVRANGLATEVAAKIKKALPQATVHDQKREDHTFFMRYVATME
jgi:hypothetical protein